MVGVTGLHNPRQVTKSKGAASAKGGIAKYGSIDHLLFGLPSTIQCLAETAACLLVKVTTLIQR